MPKKIKKKIDGGNICGGVISSSINRRNIKRYGIWADTMAYIIPDKQYDKYIALKKQGKDKQATKIFEGFAHGQV